MTIFTIDDYRKDKFCTIVDEARHYQFIVSELKQELSKAGQYTPGNPEVELRVTRMAVIEFAVIFIMRDTAHYENSFHYFDFAWIAKKLGEFRSDLNATDEEIKRALNSNVLRKRLIAYQFPDRLDLKYKYNQFYLQPKQTIITTPTPPAREEVNPFISEEYLDIVKNIK
jgi:hypothetical protein